jgi:hypothetical protein
MNFKFFSIPMVDILRIQIQSVFIFTVEPSNDVQIFYQEKDDCSACKILHFISITELIKME